MTFSPRAWRSASSLERATFTVTVMVGEASGVGSAGSKQAAEQDAAAALLRSLTP